MIGEVKTDGKTLWINSAEGCILRVNCMDMLKDNMESIVVDIHTSDDMIDVSGVKY